MAWFKSKKQKEIEQKMLVKRTINSMEKQIARLEEQKKSVCGSGKESERKRFGTTIQFGSIWLQNDRSTTKKSTRNAFEF